MLRNVIKSIRIKITTTLKLLLSHFFKKGCNPKMQNNYFLKYTRETSLSRVCICKEITVHALQIFVCVRERENDRHISTGHLQRLHTQLHSTRISVWRIYLQTESDLWLVNLRRNQFSFSFSSLRMLEYLIYHINIPKNLWELKIPYMGANTVWKSLAKMTVS